MSLIHFVATDRYAERIVLGWRMSHPLCPHPRCWCRLTPGAMKHGLDPSLYAWPPHQHIVAALVAIAETGEPFTAGAYEAALRLDGRFEAAGGWGYLGDLLGQLSLTCEVEGAVGRLLALRRARRAVEGLVRISESAGWVDHDGLAALAEAEWNR
jgi:hypothetical protein